MATEVWRCDSSGLLVSLHTRQAPNDDEWKEYLNLAGRLLVEQMGSDKIGGLSLSDGGAPSMKQRNALNLLLQRRHVGVAIVSDSIVVRGVVTALHWFNRDISVFAASAMGKAVQRVGVPTARHAELFTILRKMQGRLPRVALLEKIRLGTPWRAE
jgi:hypothetical protein